MCLESTAWAAAGASPAFCWQAYTPNYRRCWDGMHTPGYRTRGYASIGYTCVGDYCSAMDPAGTPAACAKFVSRADAVDVQTGKCTGTSGPAHRKDHMRTRDEFCMRYATLKHGLGDESANILSSNTTKPPS